MKKLFALLLLSCALLVSCEDWLQEEPKSLLAPDNYFNSADECLVGLKGVYSNLGSHDLYWINLDEWLTHGNDLIMSTRLLLRLLSSYYLYEIGNVGPLPGMWVRLYKGVGDANMVIARIGSAPINEEIKNQYIGEARFLRALFYYHLSNLWGDVPMWLDELDPDKVGSMSRTPVTEVREQIISDLEFAASKCPASFTDDSKARATRWAAMTLLAKVYLMEGDFASAKEWTQKVIDGADGTYHSLLPVWSDVFDPLNEHNQEHIFVVDFLEFAFPKHSIRHSNFTPRGGRDEDNPPGYNFTGYGNMAPTPEFVAMHSPDDTIRAKLNYITELEGVQFNYVYMPKFWDPFANRGNSSQNFIVLRYADVLLMHAEAENELNGPTTEAYNAINRVRSRVNIPDLSGLSQDQFRDAIKLERALELAAEGHRKYDLIRWGELISTVRGLASNPLGAENIQEKHLLCPIPPDEILKNPNLTQNPGYEN